MPETTGNGASLDEVKALMAPVDQKASNALAKADEGLTGADRQQAVRVQVTPDANGRVVFFYPKAYAAGTKPAVTTTAETPQGASYRNDASIEENSATNTQVVIIVQRVPRTLTVSLLGAVLSIFQPVTTPVWINILIRAPI